MKKNNKVRIIWLALAILVASMLSIAVYSAQNQISLDSPASLPSDI